MTQRFAYFLLALVADVAAALAFAWGFLKGAIRAAYERGFARGYGSEGVEQVYVEDDE